MRSIKLAMEQAEGTVENFLAKRFYPSDCNLRTAAESIAFDKRTLHAYLKREGFRTKGQSEGQLGALNSFHGRTHNEIALVLIGRHSKARQPRMKKSAVNGRYGADDSEYKWTDSPAFTSGIGSYRRRILLLRGNKCEQCGAARTGRRIDVHHRNGNRHDNADENLIVLCRSCHLKLHYSMRRAASRTRQ